MSRTDLDVLVVGAGPVGMALAAMLRTYDLQVRIIDKASGSTPFSKAVGVHASTIESMSALGIQDDLIRDGRALRSFRVNDPRRTEPIMEVDFDSLVSPYRFVLGLPQSCTEMRLLQCLNRLGANVEWNIALHKVISAGVVGDPSSPAIVELMDSDQNIERVSCRWLLGTDGGRSKVRSELGLAFEGGDYGAAFILGDVCMEGMERFDHVQFYLSDKGYLLIVPMPNGLYRIIAQTDQTMADFSGHERPEASLEQLQSIVERNGPGGLRVHSPEWLTSAPFYFKKVDNPLVGRVALAGDSFHLFSPLGAQGLNTGFQDVFNLAWKIAYVEKGWADGSIVDSYAEERATAAKNVGEVTSRVTRFITERNPIKRSLMNQCARILKGTQKVQISLPRLISGLMQSYGRGVYLSGLDSSAIIKPGSRMPNVMISNHEEIGLIAPLIHGRNFTILMFSSSPSEEDLAEWREVVESVDIKSRTYVNSYMVTPDVGLALRQGMPHDQLLHDVYGEFGSSCGAVGKCLFLVRPDGYVAMAMDSWVLEPLKSYFERRRFSVSK